MADQNVLDADIDQLVQEEGVDAMPLGFSICEEAYDRAALPRPWVSESGLGTSPLDLFIGGILQSAGITVEVMKKHAGEENTALYQAVQILEKHDIVDMMKVHDHLRGEGQHARRPGCAPRQLHLEAERGEREQGTSVLERCATGRMSARDDRGTSVLATDESRWWVVKQAGCAVVLMAWWHVRQQHPGTASGPVAGRHGCAERNERLEAFLQHY